LVRATRDILGGIFLTYTCVGCWLVFPANAETGELAAAVEIAVDLVLAMMRRDDSCGTATAGTGTAITDGDVLDEIGPGATGPA
jgi:hypothetical protein